MWDFGMVSDIGPYDLEPFELDLSLLETSLLELELIRLPPDKSEVPKSY